MKTNILDEIAEAIREVSGGCRHERVWVNPKSGWVWCEDCPRILFVPIQSGVVENTWRMLS